MKRGRKKSRFGGSAHANLCEELASSKSTQYTQMSCMTSQDFHDTHTHKHTHTQHTHVRVHTHIHANTHTPTS